MLLLLRLLCFLAWVFALRGGATLMATKAINGHEFFCACYALMVVNGFATAWLRGWSLMACCARCG